MAWEPNWPDPCPGCARDTLQNVRPATLDGVLCAVRTCSSCRHEWPEPAPTDLSTNDIVRVYAGDQTVVAFIDAINGDELDVAGRRVPRWQVVIY